MNTIRSDHTRRALLIGALLAAAARPAMAFCGRTDQARAESFVALIDFTDEAVPRPQQLTVIDSQLRSMATALPQGSRMAILALSSPIVNRPSELTTLFDACKPRDPADVDPFCESRPAVLRNYTAQWQQPLAATLHDLMAQPRQPASTSPLLASVKLIADRRLLATGARRRLMMITDLRENSDVLTSYPRLQASFAQLAARHPAVLDVDLTGVEVSVLKMSATPRSIAMAPVKVAGPGAPNAPAPELDQFWADWARGVKAKDFRIQML